MEIPAKGEERMLQNSSVHVQNCTVEINNFTVVCLQFPGETSGVEDSLPSFSDILGV